MPDEHFTFPTVRKAKVRYKLYAQRLSFGKTVRVELVLSHDASVALDKERRHTEGILGGLLDSLREIEPQGTKSTTVIALLGAVDDGTAHYRAF